MKEIELFYRLKGLILEKYKKHYPYYSGTIQEFGNKEIAQLLDLVDEECNERVSEKWVYTHLKPQYNNKLPRKDMLSIFSCWLGYSGWDEFKYQNETVLTTANTSENSNTEHSKKSISKIAYIAGGLLLLAIVVSIAFSINKYNSVQICFKDKYTKKIIESSRISVYSLHQGNNKSNLKSADSCYTITTQTDSLHIAIESPYYKSDTLSIKVSSNKILYEYDLQPDDYAMMLRAYMNADVSDWNRRKKQLNDILHENAIIQEVMFQDIGVEFLNKTEFINKITTPTKLVKQMEVIEIKYENKKIISLKYMQKE